MLEYARGASVDPVNPSLCLYHSGAWFCTLEQDYFFFIKIYHSNYRTASTGVLELDTALLLVLAEAPQRKFACVGGYFATMLFMNLLCRPATLNSEARRARSAHRQGATVHAFGELPLFSVPWFPAPVGRVRVV